MKKSRGSSHLHIKKCNHKISQHFPPLKTESEQTALAYLNLLCYSKNICALRENFMRNREMLK